MRLGVRKQSLSRGGGTLANGLCWLDGYSAGRSSCSLHGGKPPLLSAVFGLVPLALEVALEPLEELEVVLVLGPDQFGDIDVLRPDYASEVIVIRKLVSSPVVRLDHSVLYLLDVCGIEGLLQKLEVRNKLPFLVGVETDLAEGDRS